MMYLQRCSILACQIKKTIQGSISLNLSAYSMDCSMKLRRLETDAFLIFMTLKNKGSWILWY